MNTVFWNVDTQIDFMRPDGKLYVHGAEKIEENLEEITRLAKKKNKKVVNSADWHNENSAELSKNPDFINTFPEHCMENTKGAEFIPATRPEENDYYITGWNYDRVKLKFVHKKRNLIIYKDKFDVFSGNKHTDEIVEALRIDRAIVYGVATNVCVDFAVRGLAQRNIEVYVVEDAIKELPNMPLPYDDWSRLGVKRIKTKDIEKYLGEEK